MINALSDEAIRASAPQVRRAALKALAEAPGGTAPDAGSVHAHLSWREPRRGGSLRERLIGWTLREAEVLGVTGLGAAGDPHARAAVGRRAAKALPKVLPEPVDHVLIQADLTAVAPGPLVAELAASWPSPPTSSRPVAPPSTASRPSPYAARSTPGAARPS